MKFFLPLIIVFALVDVSYSQSKVQSANDRIIESERVILRRLADIERRDSLERASRAVDNAVGEHLRELMNDGRQHREFIMSVYQYTIAGAGVIVALMAFIGWAGFRDGLKLINRKLENELQSAFKEKTDKVDKLVMEKMIAIDKLLQSTSAEVQKKVNDFDDELRKQQEVNKAQTELLNSQAKKIDYQKDEISDLDRRLSEIKDNIHVNISEIILQYLDAKGSRANWHRRQEIICTSKEYPVLYTREDVELDPPGKVEFVDAIANDLVETMFTRTRDGGRIIMMLRKPLILGAEPFHKEVNCRLIDGFPKLHEQWGVVQPYSCDKETFELRLHPNRNCKRVWLQRHMKETDGSDSGKEVDCEVAFHEPAAEKEYYSYKITIPSSERTSISPPMYVVHWEFSE